MSQVTLSFQVDENVRAILADAAKVTGRDVDQLLRDLAEDYARQQQVLIDEPDWLIREMEEGIREADDPNTVWVPHEEAMEEMRRELAELDARIALSERK
jgi:hypothetical protein